MPDFHYISVNSIRDFGVCCNSNFTIWLSLVLFKHVEEIGNVELLVVMSI